MEQNEKFEVSLPEHLIPDTKNKAFKSAFWRGVLARLEGKDRNDCPYPDWRTVRGSITWSRAFMRYWIRGWDAGAEAKGVLTGIESGREDTMSEKSSGTIEERVIKAIVWELGVKEEDVTEDKNFADDLGCDSLDAIEVVMALEEEFGIEIPDEEGETWGTVKQAIEGVEKLMKDVSDR